jgi:hypothetical protein
LTAQAPAQEPVDLACDKPRTDQVEVIAEGQNLPEIRMALWVQCLDCRGM